MAKRRNNQRQQEASPPKTEPPKAPETPTEEPPKDAEKKPERVYTIDVRSFAGSPERCEYLIPSFRRVFQELSRVAPGLATQLQEKIQNYEFDGTVEGPTGKKLKYSFGHINFGKGTLPETLPPVEDQIGSRKEIRYFDYASLLATSAFWTRVAVDGVGAVAKKLGVESSHLIAFIGVGEPQGEFHVKTGGGDNEKVVTYWFRFGEFVIEVAD